jgi:hypothetical protein
VKSGGGRGKRSLVFFLLFRSFGLVELIPVEVEFANG